MMKLQSKKKGTIEDLAFVLLILLSLAFTFLIGLKFLNELGPAFGNASLNRTIVDNAITAWSIYDSGFLLIALASVVSVLVSSFFIKSHPVYFITSFIVMVVMVPYAVIVSNIYGAVIDDGVFATEALSFQFMTEVFKNIPILFVVFGSLALIVIYGKTRDQSAR